MRSKKIKVTKIEIQELEAAERRAIVLDRLKFLDINPKKKAEIC